MSAGRKRKRFTPPNPVPRLTPQATDEELALEAAFVSAPAGGWAGAVPAAIHDAIQAQMELIDVNKHPELMNGKRRNCLRPGTEEV